MRKKFTKKEWERSAIDRLLSLCPLDETYTVEEGENPDFVLVTTTRRIGIEHTQVFQPTNPGTRPLQEQENLQDQLIEAAEQRHATAGGPPLWVSVSFSTHHALKKPIKRLAEQLTALVIATNLTPGEQLELDSSDVTDHEGFPAEFDRIFVARLPDGEMKNPHWHCSSRAGWEMGFESADVQEEIDKKSDRCGNYRQRCDELWLLLDIDTGRGPSGFIELTKSAKGARYKSGFDRVLVLSRYGNRVDEVVVVTEETNSDRQ